MIEINLLPGGTRRTTRRSAAVAGGKFKLRKPDRYTGGVAAAWVIGLGVVGFLFFTNRSRMSELQVAEQAALRDSARFAAIRARGDSLMAQEAIISSKLQVIQEIDAGRFTWPHLMDETSRALPPYVWLVSWADQSRDARTGKPRVRMRGRAGNYPALSRFLEDLERSPFITGVRLISSQRMIENERAILDFVIEMDHQEPPPDVIETVPLFAAAQEGEG